MHKQSTLLNKLANTRKGIAILIDPEKASDQQQFDQQLAAIKLIAPAFIFIGGSTVSATEMNSVVERLKASTGIPLIIFPGGISQINTEADGILFLSLISGRNPRYLIDAHVEAASQLFDAPVEVISTGYILVEGGITSAVARVSETDPIPQDEVSLIASTAKAGILLGMHCLYVDAGSGASTPVSTAIINALSGLGCPLIIGGGLRTIASIKKAHEAGASLVVIGNKLEEDPSFMKELAQYNIKNNG
ncbi:MAG: geranylgeranylglyceryl phosphate synthase family protein [Crocinitomicaceae bacterium]|jgi:phosphoglycerol geranylgeranyltransferase|nr:geranylgeranylglyceryl phosphate synthase family protein [Crocinitomicaceae bacterium]